jgi:hypothetical protein
MCTFAVNSNSREDGTAGKSSTGAPSVNFAIDTDMEVPDPVEHGLAEQDAWGCAYRPHTSAAQGLEDVYAAVPHVCLPSDSVSSVSQSLTTALFSRMICFLLCLESSWLAASLCPIASPTSTHCLWLVDSVHGMQEQDRNDLDSLHMPLCTNSG